MTPNDLAELYDEDVRVDVQPTVYINDKTVLSLCSTQQGRTLIEREFLRLLRKVNSQTAQITKLLNNVGDKNAAD